MWLDDTERRSALEQEFARIHAELRRGAGTRAAQAIHRPGGLPARGAGSVHVRCIAGIDEAGRGTLGRAGGGGRGDSAAAVDPSTASPIPSC